MSYAIAHKDGTVVCRSSLPYLGYPLSILKGMEHAGYVLLVNGKRAKFPTAAQFKEVQYG